MPTSPIFMQYAGLSLFQTPIRKTQIKSIMAALILKLSFPVESTIQSIYQRTTKRNLGTKRCCFH